MRLGVIAACAAVASPAAADPVDRLEASGFLGIHKFDEENGLGNALAPEQRPQTAPTFGARVSYLALQTKGDLHLDLGGEAELSFTPSWTGYGFEGPRPSYFAPVFGYRAGLILRLGGGWFQPHVTGGVGGATVVSSSIFMADETDPVFLWGLGAAFEMTRGWHLRFDGRQYVTEAMGGDTTSNFELIVSAGVKFGYKAKIELPPPKVDVIVETPPEPPKDSDNDGIPDNLDACRFAAEAVNGINDQDGCPEPDPDGDKIISDVDKCPDRAEDFDKFEDEDGCPDDDNDKDGVVDARDACPNEPENKNGITDDDGCADQVPATITTALAGASKVKFEGGRARLSKGAKAALDMALLAMLNNPKLKILITAHPERDSDNQRELARKRHDVVKWYLIEQGVSQSALVTAVGPVAAKKAPVLVMSVALDAAAPPPGPAPAPKQPAPAPAPKS